VLDVGANTGQYAKELRRSGYSGRIVSFEPLAGPFRELAAAASKDACWDAVNVAAGERAGREKLHVAANTASSSFLDMLPVHEASAPEARYVREEDVEVRTLPALLDEYERGARRTMVKLDVQGFERRIVDTAKTDARIAAWQLEMSLVSLYRGECLMPEMLSTLSLAGFELATIDAVFSDRRTGRVLQVDGVFLREAIAAGLA
jgi:FkbM family methyltransferase